jgi:hypothetical protein
VASKDSPDPTWSDGPEIPDWHCVHHGVLGDGEFVCEDPEHL